MKKICVLLLCIVLLCMSVPFGMLSASAETSGLYTYTVNDGKATITDVDDSISGDVVIPSNLGGYPVTAIGYHAFYENNAIESITVLENVEKIESSAFNYLEALKSIVIMSGEVNCGFYKCDNVESITFGNGVSKIKIDSNISAYCNKNLSSITVDEENPYYCTVDNVLFDKDKTTLLKCVPSKKGTYTIPDTVTYIGYLAFYNSELTNIEIPNSVTRIGASAFSNSKITNIEIPNSVTMIGSNAFQNSELTSLVIPDSVVQDYYTGGVHPMFDFSRKLSYVKIGSGYTVIPSRSTWNNTSLKSIVLPENIEKIQPNAFLKGNLEKIVILNSNCDIFSYDYLDYYRDVNHYFSYVYGKNTINKEAVIYGYADSTAQAYAEKFDRKFVEIIPEFFTPEIDGVSITAGSDITVNYYSQYGAIADLRVTLGDKEYYLVSEFDSNSQMYVYKFNHVVPQKLGDTVKAELIVNGEVVDVKEEFSVKGYLDTIMGSNAEALGMSEDKFEKLVTLSKDILNYGAAAQKYYGYNESALVNEGITGATEFVAPTTTDKDISKCEANGFKFNGQNLRFDNVNRLMFRFELDPAKFANTDGLKIKIENGNGTTYLYPGHFAVAGKNMYLVYSDPISATEFDDVYTVTAYKNGTKLASVKYSVNSYIYAMCNKTAVDENMLNLAKATYNYGISAEAYAAAN